MLPDSAYVVSEANPISTLTPTPPKTSTPSSKPAQTGPPTPTESPTSVPTAAPSPAVADLGPSFTVDRDAVNVRAGPETNYPVIGAIDGGQAFTPNGRNRAGDWLRFNWEGEQGWVYASLLIVNGLDEVPVASAPQPPTPPTSTPTTDSAPQQQDWLARCDSNGNGQITCNEAAACEIGHPVPSSHPAYQFMKDGDSDGQVCE